MTSKQGAQEDSVRNKQQCSKLRSEQKKKKKRTKKNKKEQKRTKTKHGVDTTKYKKKPTSSKTASMDTTKYKKKPTGFVENSKQYNYKEIELKQILNETQTKNLLAHKVTKKKIK
jgi:beta-N-acetylglucosaminidase